VTDDPRLEEWLAAGSAALAAPAEARLEALCAAVERRAALVRSLEAEPPRAPSEALATRLARGEADLRAALEALRGDLAARLGALRDATRAHAGYRPARGSDPAFLSRSV
jgi:hypothetical protein